MKRVLSFCFLLLFLAGMELSAQDEWNVKFRSRALLDAMVSGYGNDRPQGYYSLEDFRVGFKAVNGQYEIKSDIGLGRGKVAVKDLLLNYHFRNAVLAFGNAYEPFSMDMLCSTVDLRFHQSASSVQALADSRKLGMTYHYYTGGYYLSTGIYTNNDINSLSNDKLKKSFVSTSRAVFRKKRNDYTLFHIGGAFSYRTAQANVKGDVVENVSSQGVTSMFTDPLLEAEVTHAGSEIKGQAELYCSSSRFMLQSEFLVNRINRKKGMNDYCAYGGYVQMAFLLKGRGFEYDEMYAVPGRPSSAKSVELVTRLDYTNLNDGSSGIYGGEEYDFSIGANFYLNRSFGVKINGSYVWTDKYCNEFYRKDFFLAQMRLQYVF